MQGTTILVHSLLFVYFENRMTWEKNYRIQNARHTFLCASPFETFFSVTGTQQVMLDMFADRHGSLHVSLTVSDFNRHWIVQMVPGESPRYKTK